MSKGTLKSIRKSALKASGKIERGLRKAVHTTAGAAAAKHIDLTASAAAKKAGMGRTYNIAKAGIQSSLKKTGAERDAAGKKMHARVAGGKGKKKAAAAPAAEAPAGN